MNLTAPLSVLNFTTLARVKALAAPTIGSTMLDAEITAIIGGVSAQFVRFMGLHALKVDRTEQYEVRKFCKMVSLDAKPIDSSAVFTLKYGSVRSSLSTYASSEYSVNNPGGWVRLLFSTPHDPGFVEVTYTAGFGTTTDDLI